MRRLKHYYCKDVEMLLASQTIAGNFLTNLPELALLRTNWNEEYARQLSEKIDDAIEGYLGIDRKKELKEATERLKISQASVIRDLFFLKRQIQVDHPEESEKILGKLGFQKYGDGIKNQDQEALIEMLFLFRKEMTDRLKSKICGNGINPELIDRISGYADQVKQLNIIQETMKKTTKEVTAEVATVFNGIYDEVSGICKIAQSYYNLEPLKKEQFVFSGIVDNMNFN